MIIKDVAESLVEATALLLGVFQTGPVTVGGTVSVVSPAKEH